MIVVINYGVGNFGSVEKALKFIGKAVKISNDPRDVRDAEKIILPGVGAFRDAITFLEEQDLIYVIKEEVAKGKPLLGICLGLQLLFEESEEGGLYKGLSLLKGRVVRFEGDIKVPHMGWNSVSLAGKSYLLEGIPDNTYFYFANSYYADAEDKVVVKGITRYGVEFPSVVERGNIFGTQFHPEKSGNIGLKVLENFANI